MLPIFPSTEIINFLQVRKDEYNNNEGWCSLRGWVSLTNKPEEEIRIYLLLLLQESFPDLIFTAESNRLDVSCFCKHPHELQNFNYHIRPLLIWEVKRIDGSSFENTRTQMELYIKEHQLPFGALFYNALEMVFLSCQGETIRIETIENLKELIDKLRDNLSLALKEIYDLFLTASKFGNSAFDAIIKLIELFSEKRYKRWFKGCPTFQFEIDGIERQIFNPVYDNDNDSIVYYSVENEEFRRNHFLKLIGII